MTYLKRKKGEGREGGREREDGEWTNQGRTGKKKIRKKKERDRRGREGEREGSGSPK